MRFFVVLALALACSQVSAHSHFTPTGNLPGRTTNPGLKTGPCGGIARTMTPKVLASGSQVRVDWQETINHPGYFEFYFSAAGDANWVKLATVQDMQNGSTDLPHNYSTMLTLPTGNCTDCTIQMIQVMTENPASPSYYYSCADIQITTGSVPNPSPAPQPAPSPQPAPDPGSCH